MKITTNKQKADALDWLEKKKVSINRLAIDRESSKQYWHIYWDEKGRYGCIHYGGKETHKQTLLQSIQGAMKKDL